ncbi:MAG: hypothetical protein ACRDJK_14860, partial [Actinomycetota bacterium]
MIQVRGKRMMFGLALLAGFVVVTFGMGLGLFFWSESEPPAEITRGLAAAKPWFFLCSLDRSSPSGRLCAELLRA